MINTLSEILKELKKPKSPDDVPTISDDVPTISRRRRREKAWLWIAGVPLIGKKGKYDQFLWGCITIMTIDIFIHLLRG